MPEQMTTMGRLEELRAARDALRENMPAIGEDKYPDGLHALAQRVARAKGMGTERKQVEVVAMDRLRIGETVYTVKNDPALKGDPGSEKLSGSVLCAAFSPDGGVAVLGGNFTGKARVYCATWTGLTYLGDIPADGAGTPLDGQVNAAVFSPDGKLLVLGGSFTGNAKAYTVEGASLTYLFDLSADGSGVALDSQVNAAVFSPDGKLLVLGGSFTGNAKAYTVEGTSLTYLFDLPDDSSGVALDGPVQAVAFSPDGKLLVLVGSFANKANAYTVEGTNVTYFFLINTNKLSVLDGEVRAAAFSPDGKLLVLGGLFYGGAKAYAVEGAGFTYLFDLYNNGTGTAMGSISEVDFAPNGRLLVCDSIIFTVEGQTVTYACHATDVGGSVYMASFSPDGKTLMLGGLGWCGRYGVEGGAVTYLGRAGSSSADKVLDSPVQAAAFSPDGKLLVLGGSFTGGTNLYAMKRGSGEYIGHGPSGIGRKPIAFSPNGKLLVCGKSICAVEGETVTYVGDLPADETGAGLNGTINAAVFSPDGKLLVLGGQFAGRAKAYAVEDTSLTYLFDLPGDETGAVLNSTVNTAEISPDGKLLVLGGLFVGKAKAYAVEGRTITYVGRIGNLNSTIFSVAFSPDGGMLAVGTNQANRAVSFFSVEGTAITYIDYLHDKESLTGLTGQAKRMAFLPDGKGLVVAGSIPNGARLYAIEGTEASYVGYFRRENGGSFSPNASVALGICGETMVLWSGSYRTAPLVYRVGELYPCQDLIARRAVGGAMARPDGPFGVGVAMTDAEPGAWGKANIIAEIT